MARITKPLTNTEVQQAKAKEKEFDIVDGNGLARRVKLNGSNAIQTPPAQGKTSRLKR